MTDKTTTNNIQTSDANKKQQLSVTLDHALYERYLEESDLTEDQKQEFLQTLWNIIVSFVDLGFEVHPVQQTSNDEQSIRYQDPNVGRSNDSDSHQIKNLLNQCDREHEQLQ